jgi:2-(1,2-epoxy-1,2-dihydrophenyl)acetyl-CoA isomerase
MPYEQVLYDRHDAVALITLNRPEKLNAWGGTLTSELRQAIEEANADPAIGAIVLTGAGRAYCAGADVAGWQRDLRGEGNADASAAQRPANPLEHWVRLMRRSKPVIAAVNGVAVGIGVTHTLSADIRIASEQARFGFVFVRMGLAPEAGSTYYLAQIVGLGAAQELCLTARMIDAQEALRIGLVSRVVAPERLVDEALALAGEIAALPGLQLRLVKDLFTQNAVETDLSQIMTRESEAVRQARASDEFREAVTAFMEKRPPNFRKVNAGA